ncbi:MAG: hypothetical protein ABS44_11670 [Chryseobacterium sp. SCN 40-13]|nr:MAG: hypothetical protein ABS44_11670 [Chryseobacterium sp. SCN 40-13]
MEAMVTNNLPDLSQAVVSETELNKQEAWLKSREGKFTASNCHRLMTYEDKLDDFPKGAMTYVEEVVIDILTDGKGKKDFKSDSMDRGNEKELEAVAVFEAKTGFICSATGEDQKFVELCSYFGGTPDGLIGGDSLIEVKCPDSKTHLFYIKNLKSLADLKKHCSNYYWQIQGNLLATGRMFAYFISYDDRFTNPEHQFLALGIKRNEDDIAKLKKRLQMAEKHKQELLKFG